MNWIKSELGTNTFYCSHCNRIVKLETSSKGDYHYYPICPYCGHKRNEPKKDPEIKAVRTHFESEQVYDSREENRGIKENLGLERTINIIGYENILNILTVSPSGGYGEVYYIIIYKDQPKTKKLEE